MLPLSSFTITLGKSNHYLRIACLIHVFAMVVLSQSSLSIYTLSCMLLIICVFFVHIVRSKTPVPAYTQLSYHQTYWLLHDSHQRSVSYEQVCISFDAGLFILLTLTTENISKKLVVFTDQLSDAQYRALNVIGKTRSTTNKGKNASI